LPRKTGGRKLVRPDLERRTLGLINHLEEPYPTLVLFLALGGRRIEEAIGIKPTDLDDYNVLHIRRITYHGRVEDLQEEQTLPLDQPEHVQLVGRLRALGKDHEWIFHSRKGTPINPGNARRRYLHPAAKAVGFKLTGWHDFRHSLIRTMRRGGASGGGQRVVGHKRLELAPEVYDRANQNENSCGAGGGELELLPIDSNSSSSKTTDAGSDLNFNKLVSAEGIEPSTY
jgi:integrase